MLSTGDELVTDGGPLGAGQIRETNLAMLRAAAGGGRVRRASYGVVRDDEAALEAMLRAPPPSATRS